MGAGVIDTTKTEIRIPQNWKPQDENHTLPAPGGAIHGKETIIAPIIAGIGARVHKMVFTGEGRGLDLFDDIFIGGQVTINVS